MSASVFSPQRFISRECFPYYRRPKAALRIGAARQKEFLHSPQGPRDCALHALAWSKVRTANPAALSRRRSN
jgi:hypothetical protein